MRIQSRARHGLAWYEFDINYYGIWLLKNLVSLDR